MPLPTKISHTSVAASKIAFPIQSIGRRARDSNIAKPGAALFH
jgi:hypothetical protein